MMKAKPWKLILVILGICLAIFIVNEIIYKDINRTITIEAGTTIPKASDFFKKSQTDAVYVTDTANIDFNTPGVSSIKIRYNDKDYSVRIKVVDTIDPTATVKKMDLYVGQSVPAEDFVSDIKDAQKVNVSFINMPDFNKIGSQSIKILLQDASRNKTEYQTTLWISKLKRSITVEATKEALDIRDLLMNEDESGIVKLVGEPPVLNHVGDAPVTLSIDGQIYESVVNVTDTIAPLGTAVNQTYWIGSADIKASTFVQDIKDMTDVKVSFQTPPDMNKTGDQTVTIILTDEGQNKTTLKSVLSIKKDETPPKLYVSNRITIYIGQAISYKRDVYATDDRDGDLEVKVDSSKVNPKVEGEYTVTYSAVDSSGNITTKDVPVIVKTQTVTMEELETLADKVLGEITTEGMTMREKAWEIYEYVNKRLTYTGTSDKTDWIKEAHRGIVKGFGDCFTYYSMSNLLLKRVGFEVLSVERASKPGEARHYWHMVFCDEGWYHFDACIHKPPLVSFMLTDAQMDAYSKLQGKDNYYYRYDRSKYPSTPLK